MKAACHPPERWADHVWRDCAAECWGDKVRRKNRPSVSAAPSSPILLALPRKAFHIDAAVWLEHDALPLQQNTLHGEGRRRFWRTETQAYSFFEGWLGCIPFYHMSDACGTDKMPYLSEASKETRLYTKTQEGIQGGGGVKNGRNRAICINKCGQK